MSAGCQLVVSARSRWPGGAAGHGADHVPLFCPQAAMENHLEQRLYQPQKLLEDLREMEAQRFHTAMKYLLEDKKDLLVGIFGILGAGEVQGQLVFVEFLN